MRPPKRQRKNVVVDSDDEANEGSDGSDGEPTSGGVSSKLSTDKAAPISTQRSTRATTKPKKSTQPLPRQKKGKASTLHSFFNARTQAQTSGQASRPSSSGISPTESLKIDDNVTEEDEEIEEVDTASVRGKRKFTPAQTAAVDDNLPAFDAGKQTTPRNVHTGSRPWVDLFPPVDIEELAVHKKKAGEVDEWLRSASSGHPYRRLLVLKGPAGSGKTATVTTLAEARGIQVVEWSNPSNTAYGDEGYQSASAQFNEFLGRSGPFTSLSFDGFEGLDQPAPNEKPLCGRITLIEEVHVIARWSSALMMFRETMMLHLSSAVAHPIVVVLSEADSTFSGAVDTLSAHQLLGPDVLSHPATSIIEFNPVAPTFISKAIELVIKKESRLSGRRRIPGPAVLRALADTGDIRSAIGMLEMMCITENDSALSGRVAAKGAKSARSKAPLTVAEQATLDAISRRESTLGLFHAVGKVVYNKRENPAVSQPPTYLDYAARPLSSSVNVDEVFGSTGTDVDTFVAALHENYALSCEADDSLAHIEGCIECLSDADLIASFDPVKGAHGHGRRLYQDSSAVDGLRHDEMVFNTAVRGLLFSLPFPVKRKANPGAGKNDPYKIQYPNSIRVRREIMDNGSLLNEYRVMDAAQEPGTSLKAGSAMSKNGVENWSSSLSTFPMIQREQEADQPNGHAGQAMKRLDTKDLVTCQLPFVSVITASRPDFFDRRVTDVLTRLKLWNGSSFDQAQARPGVIDGGQDEEVNVQKLVLSDDDIEDD